MPNKYARGSEWRKWDLHLHSFYTNMNNNYRSVGGGESPKTEADFIAKIKDAELQVIGLTNYFNFKEEDYVLKEKLEREGITVFLNLEIRLTYQNKDDDCCDFHVVFDNNLKKEQIKLFLNNLNVNVEGHDKKASVLESSDDYLKSTIELDEIINKLEDESLGIKGRYLVGFLSRGKGNGRTSSAYEKIYEKTNFLIHSSENPRNLIDDQNYWAQHNRPVFQSSDAHSFEQIGRKFSWVKADPTFKGLEQTQNEIERICLEDVPELKKKMSISPQNFIKRLCIDKKENSIIDEVWYNKTEIELNPGLVAIIGNKGSGKSAIADIAGLCANTHNKNFSFLTQTKFRMPKPFDRSKSYEACITWVDDSSSGKISLDSSSDENQPERVRYIPQNFLENLCTTENDKEFEKELRSIIFQYLPDELKYGKTNLDGVIDYLSQEIEMSEKDIFEKISECNKRIVDLEEKKNPNYVKSLENAFELKRKALENILSVKPEEVEKPVHENNEEEANKQKEIAVLAEKLGKIEEQISESQCQLTNESVKMQNLQKAREQIIRVSQNIENAITEIIPLLQSTELKIEDIISFSFKKEIIDSTIEKLSTGIRELKEKIKSDGPDSLLQQRERIKSEITEKQKQLGEADRLYQNYLKNKKEWEEKVSEIQGSAGIPDTIVFYENQIKYVKEVLESDLQAANDSRSELVKSLLEKKKEILGNYALLFTPIREFISQNKEKLKDFPIEIQSTFIFDEISEKFFDYISQGPAGTFSGKESGSAKLKDLCDNVDLNNDDEICNFAKSLDECLKIDNRDGKPREVVNQLKKGHSVLDLYDYIYGLSYIKPLFELQMSGKKLSSLSPGERGAILLLFYLFIDNDDKPLIIDQPEENLDNESVYKYLVSFIKMAKKKRQIIMVTHNPNLAVVCDADQIIKMDIDKANKNTVSFIAGAIENPEINQCIVDVLEGTYPAFDNRNRKYFSKESLN